MTGSPEQRVVTVPDGLAGERLDAAMARMFGLSRTRAAALIADGQVEVDGPPRPRATACTVGPCST